METEKFYLSHEKDVATFEKQLDGTIDYLISHSAHEFKDEDELLAYVIGDKIAKDGQLGRSVEEILKIFVGVCDDIVNNLSEFEVDNIDFESKNNLLLFMKNILSKYKE